MYLLTGNDPESGEPAVYVGEAECIKDRIKAHLDKDFWNQIILFVSKDENLTKSHIRCLEGRLISQARGANRALVTNEQSSGAKLPEADREERPSVEKWPWPRNMRQKLVKEGALINKKDRLVFSEDTEFSSPSAAAAVLHGGHANGLTAWKNAKGQTLKDMESA